MHFEISKIYFLPAAPTLYFPADIPHVQCRVFLSVAHIPEEKRSLLFGHSRNRTRKKPGETRKDETLLVFYPCRRPVDSFRALFTQHRAAAARIRVNYFLRRNSVLGTLCFLYKPGFTAVIKARARDRFSERRSFPK